MKITRVTFTVSFVLTLGIFSSGSLYSQSLSEQYRQQEQSKQVEADMRLKAERSQFGFARIDLIDRGMFLKCDESVAERGSAQEFVLKNASSVFRSLAIIDEKIIHFRHGWPGKRGEIVSGSSLSGEIIKSGNIIKPIGVKGSNYLWEHDLTTGETLIAALKTDNTRMVVKTSCKLTRFQDEGGLR